MKIALNDNDSKRAKQIASYPWFDKKREWQKEIEKMLKNGFKLEVESLISKDISYVTEEYVPAAAGGTGLAGLAVDDLSNAMLRASRRSRSILHLSEPRTVSTIRSSHA